MTSELDFIAALDAEPGNHWLRQLYADFLEDQGDDRGPGMRMLAILRRVPRTSFRRRKPIFGWVSEKNVWAYPGPFHDGDLETFALPVKWVKKIETSQDVVDTNWTAGWREWPSCAAAFDAAALAWLRLTDAERSKIMAGVKV